MTMFAIFMVAMVPMLALSIDGYTMMQSKLEEQNISEYFSFSALSGYVNSEGIDHTSRAHDAVERMRTIQDKNKVLGIKSPNTWNFEEEEYVCVDNYCVGDGWKIEFGQYMENTGDFVALPPDSGGPGQIDDTAVDAIKTSLEFPEETSFSSYFSSKGRTETQTGQLDYNNQGTTTPDTSTNIKSIGISYFIVNGTEINYRIAKKNSKE